MSHQVMKGLIQKFPSIRVCAGSSSKQGEAGARPQDQVQLALHRQGEVPLRQEELPRRLTRHQTVNLTLYVITGMANFFWKFYVVHKAFKATLYVLCIEPLGLGFCM